MNFNDLPTEVQLMIFSNFNPKQLSYFLAPVCKQWRQLAFDASLWKIVDMNADKKSAITVKAVLDRCPRVVELSLHGTNNFAELIPKFVNFPRLRKLRLSFCKKLDLNSVVKLVEYCPLVEEVKIYSCDNLDPHVLNVITGWKRLKSVIFQLQNDVSSWWFVEHVVIIPKKTGNVDVKLDFYQMSYPLFSARKETHLKYLRLDCRQDQESGYDYFPAQPRLSDLYLTKARYQRDFDVISIIELKLVRHLNVTALSQLTSLSISLLFRHKSLHDLEDVVVQSCENLDDTALKVIAQNCSSLINISLYACPKITNIGLTSIMSYCKNLQCLSLDKLDKITVDCFLNISSLLPALSRLEFYSCKQVTFDDIGNIVKLNPNISI